MQSNNRPLLIGITGTYGSGKSTFCKLIEKQYTVIYADQLAHEVLEEEDIKKLISNRWGEDIIQNGKPDRQAISLLVFSNRTEREFLNSIIHPRVLQKMQNIVSETDKPILFFEIPLLFEAKLETCFDHIVLLTVNPDIRIERISQRDRIDRDAIEHIIKAQMPESVKIQLADTVIRNDNDLEDLEAQCQFFMDKLEHISKKLLSCFSVNE